jgi:Reverse transcriptase (RNA-dependent DNA polymerase)
MSSDQDGSQAGSPAPSAPDSPMRHHLEKFPVVIGLVNVAEQDRHILWGKAMLDDLFDTSTMSVKLSRINEEDPDEVPNAWRSMQNMIWEYLLEWMDTYLSSDDKHLLVEDSKGTIVLIGHPAISSPTRFHPRRFDEHFTAFIRSLSVVPIEYVMRSAITITIQHRNIPQPIYYDAPPASALPRPSPAMLADFPGSPARPSHAASAETGAPQSNADEAISDTARATEPINLAQRWRDFGVRLDDSSAQNAPVSASSFVPLRTTSNRSVGARLYHHPEEASDDVMPAAPNLPFARTPVGSPLGTAHIRTLTYSIKIPNQRNVELDVYGTQVFVPENKSYTLRLKWDQEKSLKSSLPPFTPNTTGLDWYEALTTRCKAIGIFIPPYATLCLGRTMGTYWPKFVEDQPEYSDNESAWSSTLAQLLQQAEEKKLFTHRITSNAKVAEILATHGDNGYQALYEIMTYHAIRLNNPMTPKMPLDQIPRFGDSPNLQVYVRRFKEYHVQLYYQSGMVVRAPELYNAFFARLPNKISAAFRSKAWSIEMQDRTASDWVVEKVPQRLLFENIAESIENECKLANISVEEEIKARRRFQQSSTQATTSADYFDLEIGEDPFEVSQFAVHSASTSDSGTPCKFCQRSWPHELDMCPKIVEHVALCDFISKRPDLQQKVRSKHGDNLAIIFKQQQEDWLRKRAGQRDKSRVSQTGSEPPSEEPNREDIVPQDENFLASSLPGGSPQADQLLCIADTALSPDFLVRDLVSNISCPKPCPPDEIEADPSDSLPTTGLEHLVSPDIWETPWQDAPEDILLSTSKPALPYTVAALSHSTAYPWSEEDHHLHAHLDQGANITVVRHKELLYHYRENLTVRHVYDISGNFNATEGGGYLLLRTTTGCGFIYAPAYYCPSIVNNIISPFALCKFNKLFSCFAGISADDSGSVHMFHQHIHKHDVHIEGTIIHGQLWNKDAMIMPTLDEHLGPAIAIRDAIAHIPPKPTEPTENLAIANILRGHHTGEDAICGQTQVATPPTLEESDEFDATADSTLLSLPPDSPGASKSVLRMLWHQRLGHISSRRLHDIHKAVIGVPQHIPLEDHASHCPTCLSNKMHRANAGPTVTTEATEPFQMLSVDFGFVVQKPDAQKRSTSEEADLSNDKSCKPLSSDQFDKLSPWAKYKYLRGINGETGYILVVDHYSGAIFGQTTLTKAPPVEWLKWVLSKHACSNPTKSVRMDQGGDLGGSRKIHRLFKDHGFLVELTAPDAPHQNGRVERINQDIGNGLRTLLAGADLVPSLWPFAFFHFLRLYNLQPHQGNDSGKTPFELVTGQIPDLSRLRTFGCRVYVRPPGGRKRKTTDNTRIGQFMGFKTSSKNILYLDSKTREVKEAFHVRFDEAFNDMVSPPPNAVALRAMANGQDLPELSPAALSSSISKLDICTEPFLAPFEITVPISCHTHCLGFDIKHDEERDRAYIAGILPKSTASKLPGAKSKYMGAFVIAVNGEKVQHADSVRALLNRFRDDQTVDVLRLTLGPDPYEPPSKKLLGSLYLDSDQLAAIHAIRQISSGTHYYSSVNQFRLSFDNGLAPFKSLVHSIGTSTLGTPEEQSLTRFTRSRLKKLETWPDWLAAEKKQLDNMENQGMYGDPVVPPDGAILLRSHWTYGIKSDGTRKARNCCDGSERAAPMLHGEAKTYASCIEHPCMRIYFALTAALGMTAFGADATNAFANSPPPEVPTFVKIDDAYADWFLGKHGTPIDRSKVLPVLHALQGHPESGSLWEHTINKILTDLGFTNTTHEPNLYTGNFLEAPVLICRQVDDLAVSAHVAKTADALIDAIGSHVNLTKQGVINRFNGVDVLQTQHFIKISCESYLTNMLKAHGWETPSVIEDSVKPFEPLSPNQYDALQRAVGPSEGSPEHRALVKHYGFSYRSVLGELIYAYVVARLDIAFAVTHLSKYSGAPAAAHFDAIMGVVKYLRRTRSWGLIYWRSSPLPSLPSVPFSPVLPTADLPDFPSMQDPFQLIAFADAAHGTDLNTRRSISGISCMMAGAAVVFKSKTQSIAATSSTEAEFICAVHTAKIVKYLRSILHELGFTQSLPTPIYEDNRAAIDMINASKPTERSRHIDIQHFAIQEWKQRHIIVLKHIPGSISPSDALTKPLGWTLHLRHSQRLMGHYGPPQYADYSSLPLPPVPT